MNFPSLEHVEVDKSLHFDNFHNQYESSTSLYSSDQRLFWFPEVRYSLLDCYCFERGHYFHLCRTSDNRVVIERENFPSFQWIRTEIKNKNKKFKFWRRKKNRYRNVTSKK
jgi:hypothetical protein